MALREGKCIHCLKTSNNITDDHVLPKSWYPENTPKEIEKWTAPACQRCNADLGKLEEDLKIKLALCLNPEDPDLRSITQDVIRALNPKKGRDPKDSAASMKKRKESGTQAVLIRFGWSSWEMR